MAFGLTIGTERAAALERAIQHELTTRGYSPEGDNVMAEYITIMIINNKTSAQVTAELEDLIGSDFDHSFTDWLFQEAAKGATSPDTIPSEPPSSEETSDPAPVATQSVAPESSRRPPNSGRSGLYHQALSQALPSTAQKRSAPARSPSPSHPSKIRRTDVPTGPRAMLREGPSPNSRSLLDRVGGRNGPTQNGYSQDDIQARIDNITNTPDANMMMAAGFPGMNGMDMNAMAASGMGNPLMLQELMMNQMALMAQISGMMGPGQFNAPSFPMQNGMSGDMNMFQNGGMNGFQNGPQGMNGNTRGRGSGRGRGNGRGRGGHTPSLSGPKSAEGISEAESAQQVPIAVPTPSLATQSKSIHVAASSGASQQQLGYVYPERPQSPTLCKFGLKCTNPHCRWTHPSPVATVESGVVTSTEACEKGKDCKDKDCVKAHVSPAVLTAKDHPPSVAPVLQPSHHHPSSVACRFGAACTRPNCTFSHPPRPSNNLSHFAQQCRYGAGCTRATCQFQHPEGRVLPTSFHRGLSTSAPLVTVQAPEAGSMGGPSPHKSVKFSNTAAVKEKLERLEEEKNRVEKGLKLKEAEAASKESKSQVEITA
ncbi:uncharacterized protein BT62DRAFT_928398 [Guyanagaster necrorhizus]|uniref:Nab2 type CCCH zinc finger 4 domain-containing protein n=1 Tax=Guyanagaster necrorhizus TaxID=856835 RepID=A0A9P7W097_9AGAR|nr:uncharacterized protein BT62DRAFT_928398 [Guyanagaster necrorhizus MCA 3950]KAG7449670.1 hypothetical protein BT62DRAFT_928398 [Guyanagaster necrorhizus MCA 3950]